MAVPKNKFKKISVPDAEGVDGYFDDNNGVDNMEYARIKYALGARKRTAVLKIHPRGPVSGLMLDIGKQEAGNDQSENIPSQLDHALGKAGFYSAAFILQRVLADELDVNPEEIEVASMIRRKADDEAWVGEIVLVDRLANGSGFVRYLAENLPDILDKCLGIQSGSAFAQNTILSTYHAEKCATACPQCLLNYYNSAFHGLLDWRLGMMILRAIRDPDYRCGLNDESVLKDAPEFRGTLETSKKAAQLLRASSNGSLEILHQDRLPALFKYVRKDKQPILVGMSPGMWSRDAHAHSDWLGEYIAEHNPEGWKVRWTDLFNVLRQPTQALKALEG
jgi:hypothetical protein